MDRPTNTVRGLGEFGLIRRLTEDLPGHPAVLAGVGDDCAVLKAGGQSMLVSCDAALEGVHFRRDLATPKAIGWKAATAALSDIAAMGGRPRFMLVTLACPTETELPFLDGLYAGLRGAAEHYETVIVGGDTTESHSGLILDVTVIGESAGGRILLRSGARPGDVAVVTGGPGRSAAGLMALHSGADAPELVAAHLHPQARFTEGQWLAARREVHALIDSSDGLLQDAGHLADASGIGLDVDPDKVPLAPELAAYAAGLGIDPLELALAGGEDYELIAALDGPSAASLIDAFQNRFELPMTAVGVFTADFAGVRIAGECVDKTGYDHFS